MLPAIPVPSPTARRIRPATDGKRSSWTARRTRPSQIRPSWLSPNSGGCASRTSVSPATPRPAHRHPHCQWPPVRRRLPILVVPHLPLPQQGVPLQRQNSAPSVCWRQAART
eukprot:3716472-Prymnesium_polylepis.2